MKKLPLNAANAASVDGARTSAARQLNAATTALNKAINHHITKHGLMHTAVALSAAAERLLQRQSEVEVG